MKGMTPLDQNVLNCFTLKLSQYDEFTQAMLVSGLMSYRLSFTPVELVDIQDEYSSLKYPPSAIKQVAIRRDQSILINAPLFQRLSVVERTGLIFHEILYAFLRLSEVSKGAYKQESWRARQMVGSVFTLPQYPNAATPLASFVHGNKPDLVFEDLRIDEPFLYKMERDSVNGKWSFKSNMTIEVKSRGKKAISIRPFYAASQSPDLNKEILAYCKSALTTAAKEQKVASIKITNASWSHQIDFLDYPVAAHATLKAILPHAHQNADEHFGGSGSDGALHDVQGIILQIKTEAQCASLAKVVYSMADQINALDEFN